MLALLGGLVAAAGGYGVRTLQDYGRLQAEERQRARLATTPPSEPPIAFPLVPVGYLSAGKFGGPRASVEGRITQVNRRFDGDIEMRLKREDQFVVLEIVPELPMDPPDTGDDILAWGIVRFDGDHGWWELHPLLGWRPR